MKTAVILALFSFITDGASAAPAMKTKTVDKTAKKTAVKMREPASLPPLGPPADRSLPKGLPMMPASTAENIPLTGTKDNRHFLVGSFIVNTTFDKAVAFYRPHVAKIPPMKLSAFGSYKTTQGWLKGFKRGQYAFRVNILSPAMNAEGKPDPKLTRIQYYMETN